MRKNLKLLIFLSVIFGGLSIGGFVVGATWFGIGALGPLSVLVVAILLNREKKK